MVTLEQVRDYNKHHVNWSKVFSVIKTLGTTMNGQKDRFDKSDLIEMSLSVFSNGAISYANDDGVDHRLTNLLNASGAPTEQEMKFVSQVFYGIRTTQRKTKTQPKIEGLVKLDKPVTLKLVNSQGTNSHQALPATYAEFLMVVDNYSAWVARTEDLKPYLNFSGDGIEAKNVPIDLFLEVVGPTQQVDRLVEVGMTKLTDYDYKAEKTKFQMAFLALF